MFPTAVPKPILSSADKIAIYLCSIIHMPSSEIASRFDRSPRYINIVIANKKREIPDLGKAMGIFFDVLLKNTAAEADATEEETIIRGEPEYRCQGITPQEMAVQASRYQRLNGKLKNAKLEIARLRRIIEDHRGQTQPPIFEGDDPGASSTDTEVTPSIIDEMLRLTSVPKNQRRYSDDFYRFAFIFASLSPRAYRYARKQLILPAPSSLGRHFGATVHDMKQNLTQLKYVHRTLEAFLEAKNPECDRIVATIGVDAFAFRLFLKQIVSLKKLQDSLSEAQIRALAPILEDKQILAAISEDQTCVEFDENIDSVGFERPEDVTQDKIDALFDMYNNCFIYVLLPLNKDLPTITLHLAPARCGMAKEEHLQTLKELAIICSNYNIEAQFMSVDGDSGWNCVFQEMFEVTSENFKYPLTELALRTQKTCSSQEKFMAVADLLHLVKRARARYIDHVIQVVATDEQSQTDYAHVCDVLGLGLVLSDRSQLGKMRDFYPIDMFSLHNVLLLIDNECFGDAYYFMAYTLLLLVIRVPFFQMEFRLKLLNVAYLMFGHVYCDILNADKSSNDSKSASRPPQRPQPDRNLVTFAEVSTLQRIFCTIVSYAAGFQLLPDRLRTDALGTHIVEEKIGQARQGMDNRWTRILSVISRNLVRSLMLAADGTDLHSSARLKTAGCCLDDHADVAIEEFDPFLVVQVMWRLQSSTSRQEQSFITSFQVVKTWLSQITDVLHKRESEIGKMWLPNPSANASIMARLIQASKRVDIAGVIVSEEHTAAGSGPLQIENK